MNRMIIKQNNKIDKNDDDDIVKRPRSKSKEFKKKQQKCKQENENFSDTYSSKKKISRSKNIHKNEIENGINKSKIIQHDDIIFLENRIKKISFSFLQFSKRCSLMTLIPFGNVTFFRWLQP